MKADVRKSTLARRNTLSKEEVLQHSEKVCAQLKPFLTGNVAIYKSYGTEIDVRALETMRHVHFALPKTNPGHTLSFYALDDEITWELGCYGIQEPKDGNVMDLFDVMIIPLVAFDEQCNRLGHGAGYYDRYLQHFQGLKIGVAHECQKVEKVFEDAYDVPLDMIISEERIYRRIYNE